MTPSPTPDGATRGWIIPIGGGEDKENNPLILERFVQLCGGRDAKLVVIPTASKVADTGDRYRGIFKDLGAAEVEVMDFDTRRDGDEPSRVASIKACDGVFITGGNQMRLATTIGGTR